MYVCAHARGNLVAHYMSSVTVVKGGATLSYTNSFFSFFFFFLEQIETISIPREKTHHHHMGGNPKLMKEQPKQGLTFQATSKLLRVTMRPSTHQGLMPNNNIP